MLCTIFFKICTAKWVASFLYAVLHKKSDKFPGPYISHSHVPLDFCQFFCTLSKVAQKIEQVKCQEYCMLYIRKLGKSSISHTVAKMLSDQNELYPTPSRHLPNVQYIWYLAWCHLCKWDFSKNIRNGKCK